MGRGSSEEGDTMLPETKRLLLREMDPGDCDALLRVLGDPETNSRTWKRIGDIDNRRTSW